MMYNELLVHFYCNILMYLVLQMNTVAGMIKVHFSHIDCLSNFIRNDVPQIMLTASKRRVYKATSKHLLFQISLYSLIRQENMSIDLPIIFSLF